jgi:hypothetical protein
VENTIIQDEFLAANHHCTEGVTGFLFMSHILHNVAWADKPGKWVAFVKENHQINGGIFSLSPEDALANTDASLGLFLPPGYASLVSIRFPYLLATGTCDSSVDLGLGERYEDGILCK